MKTKLCHEIKDFSVKLEQTGLDRFTVRYRMQVKRSLTYAQAASEYGACIMHALACDGKLDNRRSAPAVHV